MDRGQILGGVLGLVTLLAAFLLPFSSIAEASTSSVDSLLVIFKIFVIGVSNLQTVGLSQLTELAYIYMASFILVMVAGVIGAFPRWSALLAIVGMATLTFSPFAVFSSYSLGSTGFGAGFYVMWATSALCVYAAYLSMKERRGMAPMPQPASPAPVTPA